MECILLAGGLGTRLRNTIGDYPKCMAPVNGKPFLHYIFQYLRQQKCRKVILSLGYKHEVVTGWLKKENAVLETDYVIEEEPLGTGGGIQLALQKAREENVIVINGDTFFDIVLEDLFSFHKENNADTTLALKQMKNFDRYGSVTTNENGHILSFNEKKFVEDGWINGGVYIINRKNFLRRHLPQKFSFEKDFLEAFVDEQKFFGYKNEGYFIDIGIPEDYLRAQKDFAQKIS